MMLRVADKQLRWPAVAVVCLDSSSACAFLQPDAA